MSEVKEFQQGVKPPKPEELVPPEPTREEKIEARANELTETYTRRALEGLARDMGFEPTRTEYPDKLSLAKAIAEKEFPEPVEEAEPT